MAPARARRRGRRSRRPATRRPAEAEATGLAESVPADELEALRRECDELRDALLRRRADFENYRRRVERDRGAAAVEAEAAILRQLLGTVDNLERALAASGADSGLREGVELTLRELLALLESLGVAVLDPLGQRFDPGPPPGDPARAGRRASSRGRWWRSSGRGTRTRTGCSGRRSSRWRARGPGKRGGRRR